MGRIYKRNIKYYLNNNKEGDTDIYISEKTTAGDDVYYIYTEDTQETPPPSYIIPQLNETFNAKALENFYGSQRLRLQESTGDIRYLYDYKRDTIETSYYDGAMWLKVN